MKRKLTAITDPQHGWLSVPLSDLIALGIADQITRYSYMSQSRAYLEEDLDAGTYLSAASAQGWQVEQTKTTYNDNGWKGRAWPSYDPYFAYNPLKNLSRVALSNGVNGTYYTDRHVIVADNGCNYRTHKTNRLIGLYRPTYCLINV